MKKLFVIIISGGQDQESHWKNLETCWEQRISSLPQEILDQVDFHFCKSGDNESFIPGIFLKSIEAMKQAQGKYEYILRTNLSSFFIFSKLLLLLNALPKEKCFAGVSQNLDFVSGAGMIMSKDVAELFVENFHIVDYDTLPDDVAFGRLSDAFKIERIHLPRFDIHSCIQENILFSRLSSHFHIRIKDNDPQNRSWEVQMHQRLSKFFS